MALSNSLAGGGLWLSGLFGGVQNRSRFDLVQRQRGRIPPPEPNARAVLPPLAAGQRNQAIDFLLEL